MKTNLKVLTANRLSDGIAVWFTQSNAWVERVEEAYAVSDKDQIAALETIAKDTLAKGQHCDVVLIDVEATENGPRPVKLRERIRAKGPTIEVDAGTKAA